MGEGELEETQKEVEQELAELDDGQPQVCIWCICCITCLESSLVICMYHDGDCFSKETAREGMLMERVKFQAEERTLALRDLNRCDIFLFGFEGPATQTEQV